MFRDSKSDVLQSGLEGGESLPQDHSSAQVCAKRKPSATRLKKSE